MEFEVNEKLLQRNFPGLNWDKRRIVERLQLDVGHVQLLRDCYLAWQPLHLPVDFWLYLLLLVDEINQGSSCLDMASDRFKEHQGIFDLKDFSGLKVAPESLQLRGKQIVVQDNCYLYFEKYHRAEQQLSRQLQHLIHNDSGTKYPTDSIQAVIEPIKNSLQYQLNPEQVQAIITGLLQPFSIISGGPGTGKTTIMTSLLRSLLALGVAPQSIALAAPTGRAAYRMTESLRLGLQQDVKNGYELTENEAALLAIEGQTIHRLIGIKSFLKPGDRETQNRFNKFQKLPFKVVVIDEVSMVDLFIMTQLLSAIDDDCRLIFLGDQFQLPSVESGAVLAELMPPLTHGKVPVSSTFADTLIKLMDAGSNDIVNFKKDMQITDKNTLLLDTATVLTHSHRNTPVIKKLSEYVRLGQADAFINSDKLIKVSDLNDSQLQRSLGLKAGVTWLTAQPDSVPWMQFVWRWFKGCINLADYFSLLESLHDFDFEAIDQQDPILDKVFECIENQRILTTVNSGLNGQLAINQHICQQLKSILNLPANQIHFHGEVIMIRRNNYQKQLYNGDIGILLMSKDNQLRAVFSHFNGYRSYGLSVLPEFSTAFAMTVHKSQGSEYTHVLMPMPETSDSRLLSREILYTGMTRAKQSVVLHASQAVLTAAIKNQSDRHSGLQFW